MSTDVVAASYHPTLEWSLSLSFIRDTIFRLLLLLLRGFSIYLFLLSLNMLCDPCVPKRMLTATMGPTPIMDSIISLSTRMEKLSINFPDVMSYLMAPGGNKSYSQYSYLYLFSYRVCLPV